MRECASTMSTNMTPAWVAAAGASDRTLFIRRTYGHLALAVFAFAVVEALLLRLPGVHDLAGRMTEGYNWLLVLAAFMVVSSVADRWARTSRSVEQQYLGLALAVAAQAVLFVPLLLGVAAEGNRDVLPTAAVITLLMVLGLTGVAAVTRTDFSFLRSALTTGGFLALGLIVASILFGFSLGLGFSFAMVTFASAAILYNTSNVLRAYRTDQHVAAALALFASITLLFWWAVQITGHNRR